MGILFAAAGHDTDIEFIGEHTGDDIVADNSVRGMI